MPEEEGGSRKVMIFYSSKSEPRILELYEDAINYLGDTGVETELVDVSEDASLAKEHGVMSTPAVVVKEGEESHRHLGIIEGLKDVLKEDLYGRSVLHEMRFKEGRKIARELSLPGEEEDVIEEKLGERMEREGVKDLEIVEFDSDEGVAELVFSTRHDEEEKLEQKEHERFESILGGVFTEIFSAGVLGEETECVHRGDEHCRFRIKKD